MTGPAEPGPPATAGTDPPGPPAPGPAGRDYSEPGADPEATRLITPRSAKRRYVLISALTWLPPGLQMATMVLLMQTRGLGLASVGLAIAVFSLTVASLELPTGGLADVIGRRAVLAASGAVGLVAMLWLAFATTLWQFLAIAVLKAVARALSSGPAEAWYVDTVHASGETGGQLRRGLAAGATAGGAALAVGTLTGGSLPLLLPRLGAWPQDAILIPMSTPMLLAALAYVALLAATMIGMPEPHRASDPVPAVREVMRDVPAAVVRGVVLGVRDGLLTRVLLTALGLGVALNAIEMLTPGRLADLTGDPETAGTAYGVVAAVGFAAVAVGSALSPVTARLLAPRDRHPTLIPSAALAPASSPTPREAAATSANTAIANRAADTASRTTGAAAVMSSRSTDIVTAGRTAAAGAVLAAMSLGSLAASASLDGAPGIVAAALAYTGMFIGLGIAEPVRSELLHRRVSGAERATVLSVDSLLLQIGGGLGALGLGTLAASWSVAPAWWVAASMLLAAASLFLTRQRPKLPAVPVDQGVRVATRRHDTNESLDQRAATSTRAVADTRAATR